MYTHMHTYTYIYIYIYTDIPTIVKRPQQKSNRFPEVKKITEIHNDENMDKTQWNPGQSHAGNPSGALALHQKKGGKWERQKIRWA